MTVYIAKKIDASALTNNIKRVKYVNYAPTIINYQVRVSKKVFLPGAPKRVWIK